MIEASERLRVAVVGGGVVGRAVVRQLAQAGHLVVVLAPRQVTLPALWRRADAVSGQGLRAALDGVDAVVYAAGPPMARWASRRVGEAEQDLLATGVRHTAQATPEAARLVLVGPAGASATSVAPSLRAHHEVCRELERRLAAVVRLPALVGDDDHWMLAVRTALASGRPLRVADPDLVLRPLAVEDAARAVRAAVEGTSSGVLTVTGLRAWRLGEAAEAVCRLHGGRWTHRFAAALPVHLAEQQALGDQWPASLGPRLPLTRWLGPAPGE